MTESNKNRIVKYYHIISNTDVNFEELDKIAINCAIAEVEEVIEVIKSMPVTKIGLNLLPEYYSQLEELEALL